MPERRREQGHDPGRARPLRAQAGERERALRQGLGAPRRGDESLAGWGPPPGGPVESGRRERWEKEAEREGERAEEDPASLVSQHLAGIKALFPGRAEGSRPTGPAGGDGQLYFKVALANRSSAGLSAVFKDPPLAGAKSSRDPRVRESAVAMLASLPDWRAEEKT
ncbi:hypothetical protein AOLI_G00313990 [Acnodon oligacanthus]